MDTVDIIYDVINEYFKKEEKTTEQVAKEICKALNICEKCGAKLEGEIK